MIKQTGPLHLLRYRLLGCPPLPLLPQKWSSLAGLPGARCLPRNCRRSRGSGELRRSKTALSHCLYVALCVNCVLCNFTDFIPVVFQPALVIVGHHFVRRRALVMGIVAAAGSIGGVCFPLIFAWLNGLPRLGYAWSLRVVALIVAYVRLSLRELVSFTKSGKTWKQFERMMLC